MPAHPTINQEAGTSSGLIDAIIEIGRERQRLMEAMKEALLRGDDDDALERERELTGIPARQITNFSGSTK